MHRFVCDNFDYSIKMISDRNAHVAIIEHRLVVRSARRGSLRFVETRCDDWSCRRLQRHFRLSSSPPSPIIRARSSIRLTRIAPSPSAAHRPSPPAAVARRPSPTVRRHQALHRGAAFALAPSPLQQTPIADDIAMAATSCRRLFFLLVLLSAVTATTARIVDGAKAWRSAAAMRRATKTRFRVSSASIVVGAACRCSTFASDVASLGSFWLLNMSTDDRNFDECQ